MDKKDIWKMFIKSDIYHVLTKKNIKMHIDLLFILLLTVILTLHRPSFSCFALIHYAVISLYAAKWY